MVDHVPTQASSRVCQERFDPMRPCVCNSHELTNLVERLFYPQRRTCTILTVPHFRWGYGESRNSRYGLYTSLTLVPSLYSRTQALDTKFCSGLFWFFVLCVLSRLGRDFSMVVLPPRLPSWHSIAIIQYGFVGYMVRA